MRGTLGALHRKGNVLVLATDQPIKTSRDLRRPGSILLISCYELGHQPLNLASPLAHLREADFNPIAIDTSVEPLDDETISGAQLVAISVPMHTALRLGAQVAERIRRINSNVHISFYGLYATLNAQYLLGGLGNSVISGEYEESLVNLARQLGTGNEDLGLRSQSPQLRRIVSIQPDRDALPELRRYAGLERDGVIVPAGYVETTRGCHHTCTHCPITPIYGGRFFAVQRETVIADARAQILAGARHITFGDPDFFNGPTHGLRICRALKEEFPWLTFDATIKVEHLLEHRQLIPELAELGCIFVVTAVESLNEDVLDHLKKHHTQEDVASALAILDKAGIAMRPSLLPFSPWETLDSYLGLLAFVAAQGLIDHVDPVHFSIRLLIPPGSAVLDDPTAPDWLGELDQPRFTYRWTHPDPRMDDLQRQVAMIVEQAASVQETTSETFAEIWRKAHETASVPVPPLPDPKTMRPKPPRLTESWFC
jgi:radical SAM superfamily enzyme YgiQ (UPF0313 family)